MFSCEFCEIFKNNSYRTPLLTASFTPRDTSVTPRDTSVTPRDTPLLSDALDILMSLYFRSSHRMCSVKKVFLEISQNSQENTCAVLIV